MSIVSFPSGFNLSAASTFKYDPTEDVDSDSSGVPLTRTVTEKKMVTVGCRFDALFPSEKATLEAFVMSNAANTVEWTIDGIGHSGRIVGGHSTGRSGSLFSLSFVYRAEVV